MAKKETVKSESEPKYRKSAQWFAVGVVALLALVLMIDTFRRSGGEKKAPAPRAIDQRKESVQSESDFQRRLTQEIKRRRLQPTETPDQRIETPAEKKDPVKSYDLTPHQVSSEPAAQLPKEPGLHEEWKAQEKKRALHARQAGFVLKRPSAAARRPKMRSYPTGRVENEKDSVLSQEQKRVMAEIGKLEMIQKGRGRAPNPGPPASSPANVANTGQQNSITVGRPRSEAAPKAGQKLIPTGTVIGAVLDQELMSDYTGPFRALITHDVYDVSDNYILIPKGSRVIGSSLRISNVNEPIQARMGLIVKWLVLPNGKRISFEKRVAALDQKGVPAIKDKVNYHLFAQFLGVAAYALLSSSTSYQGSGWADDRTFEGNLGQSLREQFAPVAAKYLNLVPTITLRKGTPLKIFIEDDIYAFAWETISNRLLRVNRTG